MILDTNALSAWLDGDVAIELRLAQAARLMLSPVVLGEYRFGIQSSRHRSEYEERLAAVERDIPVLALDGETAVHYATIRRALKAAGTPIPWHDLWIAAQAGQHSCPVLSRDEHFDLVPGVERVGW